MNRTARTAIAAAAVAATVAAVWWWRSRGETAPVSRGLAGLAAGEERVYDLRWDGTSVADASGLPGRDDSYGGEVHVAARLVMRGLGGEGDARLVGLRLEHVESATYELMGHDVLAGIDPSLGELVVSVAPDGALRDLRPDPDAAPAVDLLLRAVAQQSAVTIGRGDRWSAIEPGPTGVARMEYQRTSGGVVRTRRAYDRLAALPGTCASCTTALDGEATITLDRRGAIRTLGDREALVVSDGDVRRLVVDNRFSLTASARHPVARAVPRVEERAPIAVIDDALEDGDVELDRAAGWSLDRIGTTVLRFVATGTTPAEPMWMRNIAAFLRVHPEACGELLRLFAAPGLPPAGRELIASMLVAAGTPAAQTALRDGMTWLRAAYPDAEVATALSRIALVERPTPETIAWLAAQRNAADGRIATASSATLALGAALSNSPDPLLAARHATALRDELASATDPGARIELLAALGNAGRTGDANAIVARAADPEPSVRRQVALSQRKLDDDVALPLLTSMAGDGDAGVRAAAVEMLARRSPGAAAADRAVHAALAAGARRDELGPLVRLLVPHAGDATVAATLRTLLDRVTDPTLRAEINHVL